MNLVLQPEASQLHENQVRNRRDEDAVAGPHRFRGWHWFEVFWADLFTDKEQMHRGLYSRLVRVHEHVNAADVPKPKTVFFRRANDTRKITSPDGRIYVPRESRVIGLPLEHMNESRKTSDDSVWNSCRVEDRMQPTHAPQ